jgi:hypothetical protein
MSRCRFGAAVALLTLAAAAPHVAVAEEAAASPDADRVARGKYLVDIIGCTDCHTPWIMGEEGPVPDMTRFLAGHPQGSTVDLTVPLPAETWAGAWTESFTAFKGPWGVSFTRNLTPDDDTGLGTWTEQEFIDTLRNGRQRGIGRELLPPMPWPNFAKATDEDLKAIWAYLQSLPVVSNRVPDPIPPVAAH